MYKLIQYFIWIPLLLAISQNGHATCPSPQIFCSDTAMLISAESVIEGDPDFKIIACTNQSYSENVTISLTSSDYAKISCTSTVVMPAQYTHIEIDLIVFDDYMADGPVDIILSASFLGQTIHKQITVLDSFQQVVSLQNFYASTNGDQWQYNDLWLENDNPCTWHGITCDNGLMPVSEIRLQGLNLIGMLPMSINQLVNLKRLILGQNQLSGSIPDLTLNHLEILQLSANQYLGTIPESIFQLSTLKELNLSQNQFSGNIPEASGQLSCLEKLNLSSNNLSGLPQTMAQMQQLMLLDLHNNELKGDISVLADLASLRQINISNNQLQGDLDTFSQLSALRVLDAYNNAFEGQFPYQLSQHKGLVRIDLHDTSIVGPLPPWDASNYALHALNLRACRLQGEIPDSMMKLTNLSSLDLRWNALYTNNETLKQFIDSHHRNQDWEKTQTILPESITVTVLSGSSIQLDWNPIQSDIDDGAYEIHRAYRPDQNYYQVGETTDKTASSYTLTDLYSGTTYFLKVRTRTEAHANNRNVVLSEFSVPISVTTHHIIETMPTQNGSIYPQGQVAVADQPVVFSFLPATGFHVQDVQIDDQSLGSVQSYTFSSVDYDRKLIALFANDPPQLAKIPSLSFDEDAIPLPITLTISDRETPVENLTVQVISSNPELIPENRIHVSGKGSPRYLHLSNTPELSGKGIITVNLSDSQGLTAVRLFPYTVVAINDPPIARNINLTVLEDTEIEIIFDALDIENDTLTYVISTHPNHGKVDTSTFIYTPKTNYFGRDYIRYRALDDSQLGPKYSNYATVTLDIFPINDPPIAHAGDDMTVSETEPVTLVGSKSYDIENDALSFSWVQTQGPLVSLSATDVISPTFIAPYVLTETTLVFWLKVYDPNDAHTRDDCIVKVMPKDQPPKPEAHIGMPEKPVTGQWPFKVHFEDASSGIIDSWLWDFGNGYQSTNQHPIYVYDNPGAYTVTLTIQSSSHTDSNTLTHWINVVENPNAVPSILSQAERSILVDLYNSTNGTQWKVQYHWLDPAWTEDYWYGVTIPENLSHVTQLILNKNKLDGILPQHFDQLSHIKHMDLSENLLTGNLPDITQWSDITYLNLSKNALYDIFPKDIDRLSSLEYLLLAHNQLAGNLPETIGSLTQLKQLVLDFNQFTGQIPATLEKLINLTDLSLSANNLDGLLPDFIDQMVSLRHLNMSYNAFLGKIPETLMRARFLERLILSNNDLSGDIPEGFDTFENLQYLDLSDNAFTGNIPNSLYAIAQLKILNLAGNALNGPLSSRLTLFDRLTLLDLSRNQFTGPVIVEMTRLFNLYNLDLSHNQFSGQLPDTFPRLIYLETLDISCNRFNGSIPDWLPQMESLQQINMSGNNFSGDIPDRITQMTWLKENSLDLRWNCLTTSNSNTEKFITSKQVPGESWIATQTIAPTDFSFSYDDVNVQVLLTWKPIAYTSNGGYEIYMSTELDKDFYRVYTTLSKLVSAYTESNLPPGGICYFKMRTVTYSHENNPNTLYSDFTPILPVITDSSIIRPDTPQNLVADPFFSNRIILTWDGTNNQQNIQYYVYRTELPDGLYQKIASLTDTTYVDWNVLPGKNYYYKIRSYIEFTPSELYSNVVHAVPGSSSTYYIDGHYTFALAAQGGTAVYSMNLTKNNDFTGTIDMDCVWPGQNPTQSPSDISPVFYLSGFEMGTDINQIIPKYTIQLKIGVAESYTPSVLNFKLAVKDSISKQTRMIDMELHIFPKDECGIVLSLDKPSYEPLSQMGVSGFISSRIAGEPVDIELLFQNSPVKQAQCQTFSDGYFETAFFPLPLTPGEYSVKASWDIWDLGIDCANNTYSESMAISLVQRTSKIHLFMKENQVLPQLNQKMTIMGHVTPAVTYPDIQLRIYSPDREISEQFILPSGELFESLPIFFSQPGRWQVKAYWAGINEYRSSESNTLDILVETSPGRAIILGTRYPVYQKQLPQGTYEICHQIYEQLINRGFDAVDIYTWMQLPENLSSDNNIDWLDEINPSSQFFLDGLIYQFSDVLNPYLPLWLIIHGFSESDTGIQMRTADDILYAYQIDLALDKLQTRTNCPIIVLLDMPYSGAFISTLSDDNRIIITSAQANNYRVDPENDFSFSLKFFHYLHQGQNVLQSFKRSKPIWEAYNHVFPQIEDMADGTLATQTFMNGPLIQTQIPVIDDVDVAPRLDNATSLPITANVKAGTNPIDRVKVKLLSKTPLYENISTSLNYNSYTLPATSRAFIYTNILTCLTQAGEYTMLVVAEDRNLNRSDPITVTTVVQPQTTVDFFDDLNDSTSHALDSLCGLFSSEDAPNLHLVETITDYSLRGVWGLNDRHVITVGDKGTILLFNGSNWEPMTSPTQERLLAVWGNASDNVYATGENGVICHFNGTDWQIIETQIENALCGIWGTASDNIYAVGGHGTILHYDGTTWERQYTQWYEKLNAIWGRNANDIYTAGELGQMLHFDGKNWSLAPFCAKMTVNQFVGDATYLFAINYYDPIQFDKGNGWTPTEICNYREKNASWQSSTGSAFVVGEKGQTYIWKNPPTCDSPNTPPIISRIPDQTFIVNQDIPPIQFRVQDNENYPFELSISVLTSNPDLISADDITDSGTGMIRSLNLYPKYGTIGSAYINIIVTDYCGKQDAKGFLLTIEDGRYPGPNAEAIKMEDILDILRQVGEQ